MGFVPGGIMKKESKPKVIFTMGKPGSRIIGDVFCPWRNYEEGVQGDKVVINRFHNVQTWLQDNRGWDLSLEKL